MIADYPIDRNDPASALTAEELDFPEGLSSRCWAVLDYLDGTAFLFWYKGQYVVTDESLELTAYGDGTSEAPLGGPRWVGSSFVELAAWLEAVADDLEAEGVI